MSAICRWGAVALVVASTVLGAGGDVAGSGPPGTASESTAVITRGEADQIVVAVEGADRTYRLYVPASIPTSEVPLLIALHGSGGNGEQFANATGFDAVAEANEFIVAYPNGTPLRRNDNRLTWNGGNCCGPAVSDNVDDIAFLVAVIDRVMGEHAIDPARVFVVGHSNGAIMTYRAACELSDRITGVGVVAGSLGIQGCTPSEPVSLLHIHGSADRSVPIAGGRGEGAADVQFRPAAESVEALRRADGCPEAPTEEREGDVIASTWSPCRDGTAVRFVVVEGAEHPWPGGDPSDTPGLAGEPYADYDASAEIWDFLSSHPRS